MRPFNDIKIGDIFSSPLAWTGSKITYTVISKDKQSKFIEIKSSYQHITLPQTIWKKCTDRIFNRRLNR